MTQISRKLKTNSTLLALGLAGLVITTGQNVLAIETPDYHVALQQGEVEFRSYQPVVIVETLVSGTGDYNAAANEGFRRLFKYISGDNRNIEKIEMSAPVLQSPVSSTIDMTAPVQQIQTAEGWLISFVLPDKYTLESAPFPTDTRIKIREVPAQLIAALEYSGRWTKRNLEKHIEELTSNLEEMDIKFSKNIRSALYNAPFSLPFLRRNEVLVQVEELPGVISTEGK